MHIRSASFVLVVLGAASVASAAPPVVAGSHFTPNTEFDALVKITAAAVMVDGKQALALTKGATAKADLDREGSALPKVEAAAKLAGNFERRLVPRKEGQYRMGPAPVVIEADPSIPYATLAEVMQSFANAGARKFDLVATEGGKRTFWRVTLPDLEKIRNPDPADLGLTISIDPKQQMTVWSVSERAGTLQKPAATLAVAKRAQLAPVLAKIVKAEKTKPTEILFVPAYTTPVSAVYDLGELSLAAGLTDVHLSFGFE